MINFNEMTEFVRPIQESIEDILILDIALVTGTGVRV